MSKNKKFFVIGFIVLLFVVIGIAIFFNKNYVADFESELIEENNGGTMIINFEKDNTKSNFCIYLKDLEYNNAVNFSKKPIQLVVFSIDNNSKLQVDRKENWTYEKLAEFHKEIDSLEKYQQANSNYIKIRDYKFDYYVDMLSLNHIMYKYFFINLKVPTGYLLK